ncbi:lytic transglycosylase domain-containing protein [Pseudoprimorskyibacter insulae]|nr:lytic transglycosylase domain-containing protein [Pseudoprimorskyibacter insulae]
MMAGPLAADPPFEEGTQCSAGRFGPVRCIRPSAFAADTCGAIGAFAAQNQIDPGFFARLIWQESRFDPNAVSHANARGIAQFIDSTAALRGLTDSHNPAEALEHSAEYLGELTRRYGNHGLAAVAYNGGEKRADGLVAKTGGLAQETIDYVQIITGLTAEAWRDTPPEAHDFRLAGDTPFQAACEDLAKNRRMSPFPKPKPKHSPWGVQVSFAASEKAARTAFKQKTASCRGAASKPKLDVIYVENRVAGKKGYYMARLGAKTVKSANALCTSLRQSGCTCSVYKNPA